MSKSIWVYGEINDGQISNVTLELLAKAKEIKRDGYSVCTVILGADVNGLPEKLICHGAECVIAAENPAFKDFKTTVYAQALQQLAEKYAPEIFLFGATSQGRDLAPRVQAKLHTGLTADCLDLELDSEGILIQKKPFYGDNYMCDIICPKQRPQMATVRPQVFKPLEADEAAVGEIICESVEVQDDARLEVISCVPLEKRTGALDEAECIIGLGAGADDDGLIAASRELAQLMSAAIGVTRPLTDNGKFQHHEQIGQSGLTVAPKFLLNLGISGAVQYTVGVMNTELMVSVNKNPNAPIFRVSHYGYAGDVKELIPELIKKLSVAKK